jgi:hypothetical protein
MCTVDIFKRSEGTIQSIHINTPSLLRQSNHDHRILLSFYNIQLIMIFEIIQYNKETAIAEIVKLIYT